MTDWQPPPSPEWPPTPPVEPQHRHRTASGRGWVVPAVVALLVGGGAGFGIGHMTASGGGSGHPERTSKRASTTAKTITVNGTMTITGADNYTDAGGSCFGAGGYDDLAQGAEVVISDDAGRTLTITNLGGGDDSGGDCEFPFTATIPAGKHYYGVTISHRGTVKFTEAQMSAPALSIGD